MSEGELRLYKDLVNSERVSHIDFKLIAKKLFDELQQKENIIKEAREDLYQVVKWCTESKHNENTIKRYLVVDYGILVGKINEIRTKLDKGE